MYYEKEASRSRGSVEEDEQTFEGQRQTFNKGILKYVSTIKVAGMPYWVFHTYLTL